MEPTKVAISHSELEFTLVVRTRTLAPTPEHVNTCSTTAPGVYSVLREHMNKLCAALGPGASVECTSATAKGVVK